MIDKALVKTRFGKAWSSYDGEARFQKEMAAELISLYPESEVPENVLELGCGTGLFSRLLLDRLHPGSSFTFNDLSPEVFPYLEEKVGTGHDLLPGDAETCDWEGPYTFIASNASIQWWKDSTAFFLRAGQELAKGGKILLGTFLPDNYHELNSVTGCALHYPSRESIEQSLSRVGFKVVRIKELKEVYRFGTITELLRHIKKTGTGGIPSDSKAIWTPGRMIALEDDYRKMNGLPEGTPLPLTYSALLIYAEL